MLIGTGAARLAKGGGGRPRRWLDDGETEEGPYVSADVLGLIGGEWVRGAGQQTIVDPYRKERAASVSLATRQQVDQAVQAARVAWGAYAEFPAHRRSAILVRAADMLVRQRDELVRMMVTSSGKTWKEGVGEVDVSVELLRLSAEEASRIGGEVVPMDARPAGEGRVAFTVRFPVGVVAAITPFNAPISVTCNKLGPALAAGNCVVHKPDVTGSTVANRLAATFLEAGLPPGVLNVVHGDAEVGEALVRHPGVDLVNFTGSNRVGERIVGIAGLKRVLLELGGIAATIIHADANVERAASMCIAAAFGLSGQSCVSTQRLYVARSSMEAFLHAFLPLVDRLRLGDPMDPQTDLGPMVSEDAAARVEAWIHDAAGAGARILRGGARQGAALAPTVLTDVTPQMRVVCEEVFGPVVSVIPFDRVEDAIAAANDTPYGLQMGIFTSSLDVAMLAMRRLRAGAVVVNGPSRWRVYHMPYGGVKGSGWGREGPRYAIEDMTEQRLVVLGPAT
jgi:acyl-CoA reductase-like NAD-dependent aldehyde dehydrogenase